MTSTVTKSGIRLTALFACFVVGVASYFLVQPATVDVSDIPSAAAKREDEVHRFYEAAMLSGDAELRRGIMQRLLCVDAYRPLARHRDDPHPGLTCQRADNPELGFDALHKSHESWVQQNMPFIREISTAEKARAYAITHLE